MKHSEQARIGVAYGLAAFVWWGCVVFYFKAVGHVSPKEVLAHRIVWSAVILVGFIGARGRLRTSVMSLRDFRRAAPLAATTVLIAFNWYVFIWAITNDLVLQASLGYFINPLVNVLLGFVFLRERFRRLQAVGILLAGLGVALMWIHSGKFPVISLALAFSFGLYGLVRKVIRVEGVVGLAAETVLLSPLALLYLVYLNRTGGLLFAHADRLSDGLLMAAGIITAVPLIWFINAAKRLRYSTIGLMQYVMPTMTFFFAVFIFHEPFDGIRLLSFCLVWAAVGVYSADSVRKASEKKIAVTDEI